jgi:hypothetical protein
MKGSVVVIDANSVSPPGAIVTLIVQAASPSTDVEIRAEESTADEIFIVTSG